MMLKSQILTKQSILSFLKDFANKKIAIIDLDGTVANSMKPYCKIINEKFKRKGFEIDFKPEDNINFDIRESLRRVCIDSTKYPEDLFSAEFVFEPFDRPDVFIESEVFPETQNLLEKLANNNYKIIYATSRPIILIKATEDWINTNDLPLDLLLFEDRKTNTKRDYDIIFKKDLIKEIFDKVLPESLFYDDKPQTLYETELLLKKSKGKLNNIEIFGPPTPWNKLPGSTDPISEKIQHLLRTPKELIDLLKI